MCSPYHHHPQPPFFSQHKRCCRYDCSSVLLEGCPANISIEIPCFMILLQYIYIISGEELTRLAKDYIKYLFGGTESVRLKRALNHWRRFYKQLTEKKETDKYWLEKEIINTPTWWDSPEKYHRMFRTYEESNSDEY